MQLDDLLSQMHFKEFSVRLVALVCHISPTDTNVLLQGVQASEKKEFCCPFSLLGTTQSEFGIKTLAIWCYRGTLSDPQWLDRDKGKPWMGFRRVMS